MWKRGKVPGRVTLLVGVLGVAFGAIQARLLQVQVLESPELRRAARAQQETVVPLDPKRGPIFDRNGKELALSVDVDSVYADPSRVPNATLAGRRLAAALGVRFEEIRGRLKNGKRFAWIERKITPAERRAVERLHIPGIGFVKESKRYYPKEGLAAHVLGYAGLDNQGLDGIEDCLWALSELAASAGPPSSCAPTRVRSWRWPTGPRSTPTRTPGSRPTPDAIEPSAPSMSRVPPSRS